MRVIISKPATAKIKEIETEGNERGGYFFYFINKDDCIVITDLIEIENISDDPENKYKEKKFPFWLVMIKSLFKMRYGQWHTHRSQTRIQRFKHRVQGKVYNENSLSGSDAAILFEKRKVYEYFRIMILTKKGITVY